MSAKRNAVVVSVRIPPDVLAWINAKKRANGQNFTAALLAPHIRQLQARERARGRK